MNLDVVELFAGVGGFRVGLNSLNLQQKHNMLLNATQQGLEKTIVLMKILI